MVLQVGNYIFVCLVLLASLVQSTGAFAQPAAEGQVMPEWAKNLQYRAPDGNRYFVGVFSDAPTREEALERSWLNTLISIARVEFPFLQTIKQFSVETLAGAEYRREAALAIERVRFEGVTEAQDKGSPHVVSRVVNGKEVFTAYRLLKWSQGAIKLEVDRLKAEELKTATPTTTYDSQIGAAGKATGQLKIQTKPTGATILLDGEPLGRSNATFAKVSEGTYKLILQLDGYETIEKQIVIRAAQTQDEEIKFKKLQGVARIESEPSGALVFVDNVPLGRTPTDVKREFGTGNIRVELEDYFSETREMSFNHLPSDYNFPLRPKQGKISILSTPSGATIRVNGREVGKTPWLGQMLEGGRHTVRLSLDQFEGWSESVDIKASKSISLAPTLTAIQIRSFSSNESAFEKESILKTMAPLGKWVSAGVSGLYFVLSMTAQSAADDAYSDYRRAKTPTAAKSARESASEYDSSASSRKTIAILSGLVSIGLFVLDWNTEETETAASTSAFQKGSFWIGLTPQLGNIETPRYALSFRFD